MCQKTRPRGRRGRLTSLAVTSACVAALLAGCGGDDSEESSSGSKRRDTVTVAGPPSTLFAPLYVAAERGYFREQGVDVKLETVRAGQDAIPLVASGKVDAIVAGFSAGMFSALDRGLEFKVVGGMGVSTGKVPAPSALMVSQRAISSGKVKGVADLEGAKIATSGGPGAAGGYLLATILQTAGLELGDVKVVNVAFPDMEKAIKSGAVRAALQVAPFTAAMASSGVAKEVAAPPKGATATGVIYESKFAKSPAAQKFFTGLVKGARDLQTERQKRSPETLKILSKHTGQKLSVLEKVPFYDWDPALAPPTATLDSMQQVYKQLGLVEYENPIEETQFIDSSFSEKAAAALGDGG
jgi:NitT/TauT family transport system substrate-binding protein